MKKTIALAGGGTGGHVFPLLAIYNYLKDKQEYEFIWIGEEDSLEEEIAEKHKIRFFPIATGKLRRYFDLRNFYEPLKNLTGVAEAAYYIKKYNVDTVFSKGGYVSLPICIAGKMLGKKILIHESDMVTGMSNKFIAQFANAVFYSFPNKKVDNKKYFHSGQIFNPELIDYVENLEIDENDKLNVMVACGSQGSTKVFEALLSILPDLGDIVFHIILGEKNMHFRESFKAYPNTIVHDFITQKRLGKILKNIDIAITRGGATTLWEMYIFGIHTIIIPLKSAAGNHQEKNAEYFHSNFGSNVLDEDSDFNIQLFELLQRYKHLRKSGLNLNNFSDALEKIQEYI